VFQMRVSPLNAGLTGATITLPLGKISETES
jgi:hypothetical protein